MNKLVLWSAAVNDLLTQHGHVLSASHRTSLPDAFVAGICVVAVVAILRAATVSHVAAFQSTIPLLRTLVLIVLTLVLLSAITLTGDHGHAPGPPAGTPAKVSAV